MYFPILEDSLTAHFYAGHALFECHCQRLADNMRRQGDRLLSAICRHCNNLYSAYFCTLSLGIHFVLSLGIKLTHLCWADGLAQFTSDTPLLTGRVPTKGMLAPEPGTEGSLLKGVVDGGRFLEYVTSHNSHT